MPTIAESRENNVRLRPLTDNIIPPEIPVPIPTYPAAPSSPLRTPLPPIMVLQPDTQRTWYNSAGPQARVSPQTGGALPSIGAAAQTQAALTALQTTMDQIQNGKTYGKPLQAALSSKGQIQLSSPNGVVSSGSRPQSINTPIVAVVSATSVSFYWDGTNSSTPLTIYRDDGTTTTTSGNQTITGLTANTGYVFYVYFNDLIDQVVFVPGTVGTPMYAFTAKSFSAAQTMILSHHIPLESGGFQIMTPASGTNPPDPGDGGGGGGGGGNQPLPPA